MSPARFDASSRRHGVFVLAGKVRLLAATRLVASADESDDTAKP